MWPDGCSKCGQHGSWERLPEPSDVEAIPAEPAEIHLALPPHFNPLLGSPDPRFTVRMIPRPLADTSSKRPVGYLDTSTNEERRTSRDPDETSLDVSLADLGIPPWGDKTIPLDAN